MTAPGTLPRLLLALLALLAIALTACDSESDTTTTRSDSTTTGQSDGTTTGEDTQEDVGPGVTEAKKSIDEEAKRLEEAVANKDCKGINKFVLDAREDTHSTKENCELVIRRLEGATLEGADGFDGAGVVDFTRGSRTTAALMVVDRDGRFKLVLLSSLPGQPSTGTELGNGFDKAATGIVKAVADNDCKAFRELSSNYFGPGSARLPEEQVCTYVKNGPISIVTDEEPEVEPELLGGNASFAFYGVSSDTRFVTIIMTRQSAEGIPPGLPDLPKDAPEYVFLNAIVTDAAPPPAGEPAADPEGASQGDGGTEADKGDAE